MKFCQLIKNVFTNYVISVHHSNFKRDQVDSIIYNKKHDLFRCRCVCVQRMCVCIRLRKLAPNLCGVCWHFFDILVYTETQLLPVVGLVAINMVFEGFPTAEHEQLGVRIAKSHSLLLPLNTTVSRNI